MKTKHILPLVSSSEPDYDREFSHFLRGAEQTIKTKELPKYEGLNTTQVESMLRLEQLPNFEGLVKFVDSYDVSLKQTPFHNVLLLFFSALNFNTVKL